jgi:hypothetical protein
MVGGWEQGRECRRRKNVWVGGEGERKGKAKKKWAQWLI